MGGLAVVYVIRVIIPKEILIKYVKYRKRMLPPQVEEVSAEIAEQIVSAIKMGTLKGRAMTRHVERRRLEL